MLAPRELTQLLQTTTIDRQAVGAYLDGLSHQERVAQLVALPRRLMRPWYEASFHFLPMRPGDLVPSVTTAWAPVEHVGVNNLLMARRFSKVMYKNEEGEVAGFNAQRWAWLTGPGYFTVVWHPHEAVIDYTVLPKIAPAGFPVIRNNAWGLSYFVYRGMQDTVRRVSNDVLIGHAVRDGRSLPNYFMLTRTASSVAMAA